MTNKDLKNWIINIENSAAIVGSQLGWEVVKSIFKHYGSKNVSGLNPSDLPKVFSELYAIEADLR